MTWTLIRTGFGLAIIFLAVTGAFAGYPTSNILMRVIPLRCGSSFGTSFAIEVDGREYLITARHVVKAFKDGDEIHLLRNKQWWPFKPTIILASHPGVDIAAFAFPIQLTPRLPLELTTEGIIVGQDAFFLGYPLGMMIDDRGINNGFPIALVKKAILSGMDHTDPAMNVYYFDGHNNPGFSGGPIVFAPQGGEDIRVAAVVSGYRNQYDKVVSVVSSGSTRIETATILEAIANSGIIISHEIRSILPAIRARPIGHLLDGGPETAPPFMQPSISPSASPAPTPSNSPTPPPEKKPRHKGPARTTEG